MSNNPDRAYFDWAGLLCSAFRTIIPKGTVHSIAIDNQRESPFPERKFTIYLLSLYFALRFLRQPANDLHCGTKTSCSTYSKITARQVMKRDPILLYGDDFS